MNKYLKYEIVAAAAIVIALFLFGYWPFSSQQKKQQGLIIYNVLDKQSFDDCHIKGSEHMPLEELEKISSTLDPEKAEIVLYCSNYMCTTSEFVAKKLKSLGFKHVFAYEGGMAEWYQLGLPTEGKGQCSYLKVKVEKPAQELVDVDTITAQELLAKMKKEKTAA